ncbi:hypothetical protein D9619_011224 [Psilocybe cf. subviscida]|uniref:AA9 family lytic polysaccharide monooxygenase n=1 Tax=Psilocybe cf. subviscida TaxID=2480587 RepID=A0A8H5BIN0_9AGAR|nr:hypothetical protein D9619_011224 [Psilocybe cf. subviscida]
MRHGLATSRPMQMSDPKVLHLYPHVDYYDHCRSARMSPDPESPHSEKLPRIHDIAIQASYEDLTVPIPTHVDADMEGRVWRKLDLRLLPVVTMFYFLSFLDRSNISNARVAGLQKDLGMTNTQYTIALTVTYIPYILAELPSNLLLKIVGPNIMLASMLTLWGLVTTMQGVIRNYAGLLVCRFFLGLFEGGILAGLVLYCSFFYPRQKLQWRLSAFISAASLSGAFSGLLAFGIVNLKGAGGRPGWAWIFILEGGFTFLFGLSSYFLIPISPARASFLTTREREYVLARLKEDGSMSKNKSELGRGSSDGRDGQEARVDGFRWREVGAAFSLKSENAHVWMVAVILFFSGTSLFGMAYFTPSIVQGLGFTAERAQLMSVPPFAAAFFVMMIGSYISDRYRCRGAVAMFSALLGVIGFTMFLASTSHRIQYASLFFSIPGIYLGAPTYSSWIANNSAPHTRRATAIAIAFISTNIGGIFATWLIGTLSPAPRYTLATEVLLIFNAGMLFITGVNIWHLWRQNKKKAGIRRLIPKDQEVEGLGDRSAWFLTGILAAVALATQSASAHYIFKTLLVGSKSSTQAVRQPQDNSPLHDITSDYVRCNKDPGNASETVTIAAGQKIGFQLDTAMYHEGPVAIYLGKAPSSAAAWDGSGQNWFKIAEWGAKSFNPMIFSSYEQTDFTTTIPATTLPGQYLARIESLALHLGTGVPEIFVSCGQIKITNDGTAKQPSNKVSIPGYIAADDKDLTMNIYETGITSYHVPGPDVWRG